MSAKFEFVDYKLDLGAWESRKSNPKFENLKLTTIFICHIQYNSMGYFVKIFEFKQQNIEWPKICSHPKIKNIYVPLHFTAFKDKDKEL